MSEPASPVDRVEAIPYRAREVLAVVGIFQRLGVDSDAIYFHTVKTDDGAWVPAVVAKTAAPQWPTWVLSVFGAASTEEELETEWTAAAYVWNDLPACDRERLVEESTSRLYAVNFVTSCALRGITFANDVELPPSVAPRSRGLPS
ncbi:MAG TPA: hypothetical protein DCX12_10530 [Chloroflexi bacterium]|nr:hypothetical protein [Chloroflexota bacterium]